MPNICNICGSRVTHWRLKPIISDSLKNSWRLTDAQKIKFDYRESSFCPNCGNSRRTRLLAKAVMNAFPSRKTAIFKNWLAKKEIRKLKIAEINACGRLHNHLKRHPGLSYSEYPSAKLLTRISHLISHTKHEDITHLTYPDNSFDLVLHSEVLEHVADMKKAIAECRRILKKTGLCIFTVPLIPQRSTLQKAAIDTVTGQIRYIHKPSYHGTGKRSDYLVFWEFGLDIIRSYRLDIICKEEKYYNFVFCAKK